ncbi:hypothetical protein [Ferrimonas pelagia]|uniref:Phasin protein n=1 Tax=Ferrimonas pelagia TaxID=1177826 RepID=A0ABP9FF02_9GAMM
MNTELFTQWTQQLTALSAPYQAYQQTLISSTERLLKLQQDTANYYGTLAVEQLHNVSAIKHWDDLATFGEQSAAAGNAVLNRFEADCGQFTELAQECHTAWQALVEQHNPLAK